MLKHIEKLQKKPEFVRKRALHMTVGILMVIIVFIWISTFNIRFSNDQESQSNISNISPIEMLKDRGTVFYEKIEGGIGSIKKQF